MGQAEIRCAPAQLSLHRHRWLAVIEPLECEPLLLPAATHARSCGGGCFCGPQLVNAHQQLQESTTYMAHVMALLERPADCVIAVTVLDATDSGETKFKVTGLLLSDADVSFVDGMPWSHMEGHLEQGLRRSELVEHRHHHRRTGESGRV